MKNRGYFGFLILLLVIALIGLFINKTFNGYQNQIDRRDTLISEYAAKEDSLRRSNEELIESLTKLFAGATVEKDGSFDVQKFINHHNKLVDSISKLNGAIQQLETNLDLIKSYYGIETEITKRKIDKNTIRTTTSIKGSDKVDSALILLPHFKDRLTLEEDGTWNIKVVSDKHNKLRSDYNYLNKTYQSLLKEYEEKVSFYKNILRKMANKDLIEIKENNDSTTTYIY